MHLSSPTPLQLSVHLVTPDARGRGWIRTGTVELDRAGRLSAGQSLVDSWEDHTMPAQPGDWGFWNRAGFAPAVGQAVEGLRGIVGALDWTRTSDAMSGARAYATVFATYADQPAGADRARRNADGTWTISARTSLDDLLADPALAPVVDAARAVLAVARPTA